MQFPPELVSQWITPNARVLDLGCGDGSLLKQLVEARQIRGYGLEIDPEQIARCLANGINVIEQDMDQGLDNFDDQSFDTVVMTQTLQAVHHPDRVIDAMLRIGRECIVSFPNFGHWRNRLQLLAPGKMPVSKYLPHNWYDTPNIHFCTVRDFEDLCHQRKIKILKRAILNAANQKAGLGSLWPNLLGITAVYRITR